MTKREQKLHTAGNVSVSTRGDNGETIVVVAQRGDAVVAAVVRKGRCPHTIAACRC